jgi:DNA-binding NarL/FixJ family response regulator
MAHPIASSEPVTAMKAAVNLWRSSRETIRRTIMHRLSDGQRAVLYLGFIGYSNEDAAHILGLSKRTVEERRKSIRNKLGEYDSDTAWAYALTDKDKRMLESLVLDSLQNRQ